MAGSDWDIRISLALENGRLPKKPRWAESGEGWGAVKTWCRLSINERFFSAGFPHKTKIRFEGCSFNLSITWSVNFSQPNLLCEFAFAARTVNTELSRNTPWVAQDSRQPLGVDCFSEGLEKPMSLESSFKMLRNEGGIFVPLITEKQSPCAWPGPW